MNSTLSLVKPRKQITHGVKKKKKSKDEILKEEERKLTYAQKRKQNIRRYYQMVKLQTNIKLYI